jgi:hypothetical protein
MPKFIIESDIDVRTFEKPFRQRQQIGEFLSINDVYHYIEKYIADTTDVFTYFSRHFLCPRDEIENLIGTDKPVAINIVLGQFEDTLYVSKIN